MLADHKLAKFENVWVQDRFPRYVGRNAKGKAQAYGGGIQIRVLSTDQGATGWATSNVPDEVIEPLVGERISDLFDPEKGSMERAYGIDLALHDLTGRILGKPAYELMGAQGPKRVPIYSGAIYFDDLEPEDKPAGVEAVVASCQQDYQAGYRAFKLKIGRGFKWMPAAEGLQRDIEVVRAVRAAFPQCKVLVDANDAYTCGEFIRFLDGVKDCDLYWIEEPFAENEADLVRLKEHMAKIGCRALVADGESRTEAADPPGPYGGYSGRHMERLYALAAKGLVDCFVIDLGIVGFTRWRQAMPQLAAAGVLASPHTWCWCVRPWYVAQLAAGVGNVVCIEGIPGTSTELSYGEYKIEDGEVVLPAGPGLAMPRLSAAR